MEHGLNPHSTKQMQTLASSMEYSRRKLAPFRKKRVDLIRQFVGFHYSDDGAYDRVPVNMLELAVNTFLRQLAARRPQVLVNTNNVRLKPKAETYGLAINHLLDEIEFENTMRQIVTDAIFSVGIAKVGLYRAGDVEIDGFLKDVGQPFCDPIMLDDWVHDMNAARWDKCSFMGNQYTVFLDGLLEGEWLDGEAKDRLTPSGHYGVNDDGDDHVSAISRGTDGDPEEYKSTVDLWDVWLPGDGLFVTFLASNRATGDPIDPRPLKVVEWDGPEHGPYHFLGFTPVPGQVMPTSPVQQLVDLHDLGNRLFRKSARQAERQKTILGVQSGKSDDGQRVVDASDGQAIIVDDPSSAREYRFGGVDNGTLAFTTVIRDWFSYFAGNLDALGGLSPQAGTLGQEELISKSSSKKIQDMQDTTVSFTHRIVKDLGWYLWTDPLIEMPLVKRVPGTSIEVPVTYSADQREGDFLDYNIQIEPYSMQFKSPAERLATITSVFNQFILPLAPQLAEQGATINFERLLKTIAKLTDMVELSDIVQFSGDGTEGIGAANERDDERPLQSPKTHRVNERINRAGTTRGGNDSGIVQALIKAGNQGGGA